MVSRVTAQGVARFRFRRGKEYGPHGDTHLRAAEQFEPKALTEGFDQASDRPPSVIAEETSFRRPVTVGIDITIIPYYADVDGMVSGLNSEERAFTFATLSITRLNIPSVLAVEPV